MEPFWKLLSGSVAGTSHEQLGEPCQDYAHGVVVSMGLSSCIIVACADGAGSASHASLGAKTACLSFVRLVAESVRAGLPLHEIEARQLLDWYTCVRGQLSLEASIRDLDIRNLACTLLTAIVGEQSAVFTQIGDGAIVYRDGDGYSTAFWPQSGEYASTTFFLTSPDFEKHLMFRLLDERVDEFALFTDGLQPLALHYASRTVHVPFFVPMFDSLRRCTDIDDLKNHLEQFLKSQPVIDRTDDDKTLILATRRLLTEDAC